MQTSIQWLDQGQGKRIIQTLTFVIFIILFTWYHCAKRYNGPSSENIIEQALIGKNLAEGKGFTSQVIYPQAITTLKSHRSSFINKKQGIPDLYHPPIYPLVIAGGLKLIPPKIRQQIWETPTSGPLTVFSAFNGDNYLLIINIVFFWVTCFLTYYLAKRIFSKKAGLISILSLLLSVGIWDRVLLVSGVPILMSLLLLMFVLWCFLEEARVEDSQTLKGKAYPWIGLGIGLIVGLLFLTEYTAGLVGIIFIGYCLAFIRGRALSLILAPTLLAFLLSISWWCLRNIELTENPLALSWQNLPLKIGDPTAEPETFKNRLSSLPPEISIKKILGKGLKEIEVNLTERIWSAGGYIFSGLFFAGCLYQFRYRGVNILRWMTVITVFLLLLLQPFFNSGLSERLPAYYLSPLIAIFGSGFLLVLIESTKKRTELQKLLITGSILGIHSFPLIHNLSEPKRLPFHFPPYVPSLMAITHNVIRQDDFIIMSDIPAGLAWYSQQSVWGQPAEYGDFQKIFLQQEVGALFLSPKTLDQPFFSKLRYTGLKEQRSSNRSRYWGSVYEGLKEGHLPTYFPLKTTLQLHSNIYLLANPSALKEFK